MKETIKRIITEIDNTIFSVDLGLSYMDGNIVENEAYEKLALVIGGLLTPTQFYREDTSDIQSTPARIIASEIIDANPLLQDFTEERYYEQEDVITEAINDWFRRTEQVPNETSKFLVAFKECMTTFKHIQATRELTVQDLHDFINDTINAADKWLD